MYIINNQLFVYKTEGFFRGILHFWGFRIFDKTVKLSILCRFNF